MIETLAAAQSRPRRIDALNLWFSRGVSAKGVSLADRTIPWGAEGPAVMQLLVKQGADPNLARSNGEPPLIEALRSKNLASAQLLIELGADPNAPTMNAASSITRLVASCRPGAPCAAESLAII